MLQRCATLVLFLMCAVAPASAQVVDVPTRNKSMAAAIDKAKATLPVFFARLAKPEPGDEAFAVKIRYQTTKFGADGEHIWANAVVREGDIVSAAINNEPRDILDLKIGQRVTVPLTQLTDWMFIRNGKIHGAYTLRAMLPLMAKDQAADFRRRLAPE
jgi:uncharacterized protein YegJ (DUF2314 family)